MSVFLFSIKRGTFFPVNTTLQEVAVALNLGVWVLCSPRVKDLAERVFLALRPIVQRIAPRINTPNIADVK